MADQLLPAADDVAACVCGSGMDPVTWRQLRAALAYYHDYDEGEYVGHDWHINCDVCELLGVAQSDGGVS
ncbi:MAG: hypothetical protein ABR532_01515 [Candidatus Dormibacteria bacterium]